MNRLTESPAWGALVAHRQKLAQTHMRELFERDSRRFDKFSIEAAGLFLDYSKNRIDDESLPLLTRLARDAGVPAKIEAMFKGERINHTEGRAVLHTALRNRSGRAVLVDGSDVMPDVLRVLDQMRQFTNAVRSGEARGFTGKPLTDIVNIGIGGSDLGPLMACEALEPYAGPIRAHFVSNVDGAHLGRTLKTLHAESTLFIVASKTFTTQETLANARSARDWLVSKLGDPAAVANHFAAVSTNLEATAKFGIQSSRVFAFWDWVGGRYSLWSAIGLPIALYVGMDAFEQMLAGAHAMDEHFRSAPLERNLPAIMAMVGLWYIDFWDGRTLAVLPYDQGLHRFPAYLQQLDMESNGKSVDFAGRMVDYATGPVLFGEAGTNGQHAFYQLLHQGTLWVPADFILPLETHYPLGQHHAMLTANCFAQTQALMRGKTAAEVRTELAAQGLAEDALARLLPHKVFPGNRPSNTILMRKLTPTALGALIAAYEHKVFVQGAVWEINSFDQWGVELGKQLANRILEDLQQGRASESQDASTRGLLARAGVR
ncbi:MAG: glucose-6-phosphate isomerase [Proteobacteria bacterium]|nr:MAG: glucose-6-phosphate isomerase [Pseudomonadota bacterium]